MARSGLRKYFYFNYHNSEIDPRSLSGLHRFVDFCFKLAEYTLIVGVFLFIAIKTDNWAAYAVAIFLSILFILYFVSFYTGIHYFIWRGVENIWIRGVLLLIDTILFLGVFYTLATAAGAILEAMRGGIGI